MQNIDFESVQTMSAVVSGYTLGLVTLIKQMGVSSRWLPLFALSISVGLAFAILGLHVSSLLAGISASLMASGIQSNVKALTTKTAENFNG